MFVGVLLSALLTGCAGGGAGSAGAGSDPDEGELRKYLDRYVALLNNGDVSKLAAYLDTSDPERDAAFRMKEYGARQWHDVSYAWNNGDFVEMYTVNITALSGPNSTGIKVQEKVVWSGGKRKWGLVPKAASNSGSDPTKPNSGTENPGTG